MARSQFNHIFFGANGEGKTGFMFEIAIDYLDFDPRKRVLFMIRDDGEDKLDTIPEIQMEDLATFKGVAKIIVSSQKIFDHFLELYTPKESKFNGLVICDDLGAILSKRPEELFALFGRRRQCNIDFMWSFHGLHCVVPKGFYTYINYLYLFRTSDNHESTMKNLPIEHHEAFLEIYKDVQLMSKTEKNYKRELIINPLKEYDEAA